MEYIWIPFLIFGTLPLGMGIMYILPRIITETEPEVVIIEMENEE